MYPIFSRRLRPLDQYTTDPRLPRQVGHGPFHNPIHRMWYWAVHGHFEWAASSTVTFSKQIAQHLSDTRLGLFFRDLSWEVGDSIIEKRWELLFSVKDIFLMTQTQLPSRDESIDTFKMHFEHES